MAAAFLLSVLVGAAIRASLESSASQARLRRTIRATTAYKCSGGNR